MTDANRSTNAGAIDATELLDRGRWTAYQKLLILATALTIVLDGVDNQLLPNAVPTLIQEWGRPRREFTDALAIGPFGMMLGGLLGGIRGDRWGRRPALLGSVLIFGAFTAALAFVNSIEALAAVRFLAGLGLGWRHAERRHARLRIRPRSQPAAGGHVDDCCHPAWRRTGRRTRGDRHTCVWLAGVVCGGWADLDGARCPAVVVAAGIAVVPGATPRQVAAPDPCSPPRRP